LIIAVGQAHGYWGPKQLRSDAQERTRHGKSEVNELRVDYSRLNKLTGWAPRYSWEDGLRETIAWYAENRTRWRGLVDW
jgi:dTDP-glucose 4,6-dehydratase